MEAIYRITHKASGTTYVGSTVNVKKRWRTHKSQLRRGNHDNPYLQAAWDKYGAKAFEWAILEDGLADGDLTEREQYWLGEYRQRGAVYNLGECVDNTRRGRPLTEEHKSKISEANRGNIPWTKDKHHTEETKRKIGEANKGNQHTLGYKHTEESRQKNSEAKSGERNPMWGKRHTDEARRKMSKALMGNQRCLGRKFSDETKYKMSESQTGRAVSEETRRKIGKAHKNKTVSEETRHKLSESHAGPHPAFKHRETDEIIPAGMNLRKLCRERGLSDGNMCGVVHGKRKSHRGWTLAYA